MDSMDNFRERCEALEQRMAQWHQYTRTVARRLRWWRIPWRVAAVAALGLALALPRAAQAKTFQCGAGDVLCLIDAINAANAHGEKNTIRLEAGTYTLTAPDNTGADNNDNGLPVITSTLTITGHGAETTIIERAASAPLFRILQVEVAGTLTLKRLTIRGGISATGGGVRNSGTLALAHTTVANNGAANGGGIVTSGGTVTIAHSIIADNSSGTAGGGLLCFGPSQVTVTATTVARNKAEGGAGIALGLSPSDADSPSVIITDSTIANNRTFLENAGGGISLAKGTLVITNTTITANTGFAPPPFAGSSGGGIANFQGTLLLINSTLVVV
jgi:hypothetical protein